MQARKIRNAGYKTASSAFVTFWATVLLLLTMFNADSNANSNKVASNILVTRNMASMPLTFAINQGQWNDKVRFRANAAGATMWFAADGAYYQFTRAIETANKKTTSTAEEFIGLTVEGQLESFESIMIKATFVGANENPKIVGADLLDYKTNYFLGNDQSKWATDVPNYTSVVYQNVYQDIDLKYYGNGAKMEYDFIVAPGADYSQIKIQYQGVESISVNNRGELVIATSWGESIEQKPVIYQIVNNKRIAVEGKYLIQGSNSFGFELSGYNSELPLVIDPVLTFSSYLGGTGSNEQGEGIATDASGATYVTGRTTSVDFPVFDTLGTASVGFSDSYFTKISSLGTSLVYSTYLGGNGFDYGIGIALGPSGDVYLTGLTSSTDFPTLNAFQSTNGGGYQDVYVIKLSSSGANLIYSTYLGGDDIEQYLGTSTIAVDPSGAAYVTGATLSTDFPTLKAYQGTLNGTTDVFVIKINNLGEAIYSTYLGGGAEEYSNGIAVDPSGSAYVIGYTTSHDFPTLNGFQEAFAGGYTDAFITKFSASGEQLAYSAYLGGSGGSESGRDLALDSSGAAYIVGTTSSVDFPTAHAYSSALNGSNDVFVTKISSSGSNLIYSTYLGGDGQDYGSGIAVDAFGYVYLSGATRSNNFPTVNAIQSSHQGGSSDLFVAKLGLAGNNLLYSTYLGGSDDENSNSMSIDVSGAVYLTGSTRSFDFPTVNAFQETLQGVVDGYVAKISQTICCNTPGDFTDDGKFNIADITSGVARIFTAGPAPACQDQADSNGDGAFNIADVTYGIARIFSNGTPPNCGASGS